MITLTSDVAQSASLMVERSDTPLAETEREEWVRSAMTIVSSVRGSEQLRVSLGVLFESAYAGGKLQGAKELAASLGILPKSK